MPNIEDFFSYSLIQNDSQYNLLPSSICILYRTKAILEVKVKL